MSTAMRHLDGLSVPVETAGASRKAKPTIGADGSLRLRAAGDVATDELTRFLASKRDWVYRKLAEREVLEHEPITKELADGEGSLYLARSDRLKLARTDGAVRLERVETSRSRELNEAIRQANTATNGVVIVRPIASPDRGPIKAVVERDVKGARTQIMAAIDSENFSPRTFVAAVRSSPGGLEKQFGVRGAQATSLIGAGEKLLRELEELSVGQAVDVRLDISAGSGPRELRSLDDLSKGQRATALLLLLLGASEAPLVIDQPEDDLDNRFVYDGIVQRLRELKGTRQVIASTHNANVPVLGDAELIVALEGDGQHGWPVEGGVGSLDDAAIRALAESLLEGGPAAFNARQHLYGF